MASVEKYTESRALNQIKHIERSFTNNSNKDIVDELSEKNYSLSPSRDISSKQYYLMRKSNLYCYGRDDVKTAFGWVITAPEDLPAENYDAFFKASYDFVAGRYGGEKNIIAANVHFDEGVRDSSGNLIAGKPHMHILAFPVVPDKNPNHWQDEKICCKEVINKKDLGSFHDDFQHYISEKGIHATVKSGITAKQGGNVTVAQYKQISKHTLELKEKVDAEHRAMVSENSSRWIASRKETPNFKKSF